ncbi:unnamed protein product, partial [Urochloa humidicola]
CLVLTPLPIGDGFCEEGRVKCSSSVIKIRAEVVVSPIKSFRTRVMPRKRMRI